MYEFRHVRDEIKDRLLSFFAEKLLTITPLYKVGKGGFTKGRLGWFDRLTDFSRPDHWYVRPGGPATGRSGGEEQE